MDESDSESWNEDDGVGEGRVYFVRGEDFVKIGFTRNDPTLRVKQLATGSPYALRLLGSIEGTLRDERYIHKCLEMYRSHGEWFRYTAAIAEVVHAVLEDGSAERVPVVPLPMDSAPWWAMFSNWPPPDHPDWRPRYVSESWRDVDKEDDPWAVRPLREELSPHEVAQALRNAVGAYESATSKDEWMQNVMQPLASRIQTGQFERYCEKLEAAVHQFVREVRVEVELFLHTDAGPAITVKVIIQPFCDPPPPYASYRAPMSRVIRQLAHQYWPERRCFIQVFDDRDFGEGVEG